MSYVYLNDKIDTNLKYCVYLTVYRGNKLPPFYIGSTTVDKIMRGYRGSVSSSKYKNIWKKELKNYPFLFKTIILSTYFSRKQSCEREIYYHQRFNVVSNGLYTNLASVSNGHMCYEWTKEDKKRQSDRLKGRKLSNQHKEKLRLIKLKYKHSDESKEKISRANKGNKRPDLSEYNKNRTYTQETRDKMRDKKLGLYKGEKSVNFGKKHSKERRLDNSRKHNPKKIYQYDLQWRLIKEWESTYICAHSLNLNKNSLYTIACKNKQLSGYRWSFDKMDKYHHVT